jgi:hypothetical protein
MPKGQSFIKVVRLPDGTWDTVADIITLTETGYNKLLNDETLDMGEIVETETVGDSKYT